MAQINIACGRVERMLNGKREQSFSMVDSAVSAHRKSCDKETRKREAFRSQWNREGLFLGFGDKGTEAEGKESQVKVFISRWQKWGILC